MTTDLRPTGNRVLIVGEKEGDTSPGGIFIPNTVNNANRPSKGQVAAVGPGKVLLDGAVVPPAVQVGDKVLFSKRHAVDLEVRGEDVFILDADDILAIRGAARA